MKNQNKADLADQSKESAVHRQKREVNLRKNSSLYFQIGLILCLLAVYGLLEMNFKTTTLEVAKLKLEQPDTFEIQNYVPEVLEKPKEVPIKKNRVVTTKPPVVVLDHTPDDDLRSIIDIEPPIFNNPISIDSLHIPDFVDDETDTPLCISCVEIAPIYPGCEKEKSNEARTKCMSQKISKLIQNQFRTDVDPSSNVRGVQKIIVQFKIDKNGLVTSIKTRAPSKNLEVEAERVVKKIPPMVPGKQRQKAVSVLYNLPINFKIQD